MESTSQLTSNQHPQIGELVKQLDQLGLEQKKPQHLHEKLAGATSYAEAVKSLSESRPDFLKRNLKEAITKLHEYSQRIKELTNQKISEYLFIVDEKSLKLTPEELEFYLLFMLFATATLDKEIPAFVRAICFNMINGFRFNLQEIREIENITLNQFLSKDLIAEVKERAKSLVDLIDG